MKRSAGIAGLLVLMACGGPDAYFGFMSLGFGGHVTVDMEACAADVAGPDLPSASSE